MENRRRRRHGAAAALIRTARRPKSTRPGRRLRLPSVRTSDGSRMNEDVRCVVVGGGPAGGGLTSLRARGGAKVTLLEPRGDFDRRFRGDSIAPSILDHLDVLGLAAPMLET